MKFRKKPVVIEAVRVRDVLRMHVSGALPAWLTGAINREDVRTTGDGRLLVLTLEGAMLAEPDDWIIQGVRGELYPCKPDIFAATYEAVLEAPAPAADFAQLAPYKPSAGVPRGEFDVSDIKTPVARPSAKVRQMIEIVRKEDK